MPCVLYAATSAVLSPRRCWRRCVLRQVKRQRFQPASHTETKPEVLATLRTASSEASVLPTRVAHRDQADQTSFASAVAS